jgi:hypothetical protein
MRISHPDNLWVFERNHMFNFKTVEALGNVVMKSVILYDDLAFFSNASASLQRVGRRTDVDAGWAIVGWPIHSLEQSATRERSLVGAVDAHLIVIPDRLVHAFPFHLRKWLEQWAVRRQIQDAAVAVIGDSLHASHLKELSPELTVLVQKHGLNFITDESSAAGNAATSLIVSFSQEKKLPLPVAIAGFPYAATRDSFQGFGINE